jgi:hypothetical protein
VAGDPVLAATAFLGEDRLVVGLANTTENLEPRTIEIDGVTSVTLVRALRYEQDLLSEAAVPVTGARADVEIPPWSGFVLELELGPRLLGDPRQRTAR